MANATGPSLLICGQHKFGRKASFGLDAFFVVGGRGNGLMSAGREAPCYIEIGWKGWTINVTEGDLEVVQIPFIDAV